MSVGSCGLEDIVLDCDENLEYIVPDITTNKGGQITEIVSNNDNLPYSIQTADVLNTAKQELIDTALAEQTIKIEVDLTTDALNLLIADIDTLVGDVITLESNIQTLIANADLNENGFIEIFNNYTSTEAQTALIALNGADYLTRRQRFTITTQTLDAGVYVANFNFCLENVTINAENVDNDDTRYKLTYSSVDDENGNITSSVNNCSGHNGLNMSHSSALPFEITNTSNVSFNILYDIASTKYTGVNELVYNFPATQTQQYPLHDPVNSPILQIVRIG